MFNLRKFSGKLVALFFGASMASASWAATPVVVGGTDSIVVSFGGLSFPENADYRLNKYSAISGVNEKVRAAIQSQFDAAIRAKISGRSDFDSLDVRVSGNTQLDISGTGAYPKIQLTGLDVHVHARFKGFRWGNWSCDIDVNMAGLKLSNGDLDIGAGTVSNWQMSHQTPTSQQDCSHVLSWVPILGDYIEGRFDAAMSADIAGKLGLSSGITLKSIGFMSLDQVLPLGKIVNGFDVGAWVRTNMPSILRGGVSISLSDELKSFPYENTFTWSPVVFKSLGDGVQIELRKSRTVVMRCLDPKVHCDL